MIKRIFSDMDGTLLDAKGDVSERNAQLIKSAAIPITLVSARAPMEMKAASYVTSSNQEDGVGQGIWKYLKS